MRRNWLVMKMRLLLCGAALLAAGCATEQNPFGTNGEFSYSYDMVPQPIPDLTPVELEKIEQTQIIEPRDSSFRLMGALHNETP
jgi:hypothetical protein